MSEETNDEKILAAFLRGQDKVERGKMAQQELTMVWAMRESKVPKGSVGASVGRLVKAKCIKRYDGAEGHRPYYKTTGKLYTPPGRGRKGAILLKKVDKRTLNAFKKSLPEGEATILEERILKSPATTISELVERLGVSHTTVSAYQTRLLAKLKDADLIESLQGEQHDHEPASQRRRSGPLPLDHPREPRS